MPRKRHIDKRRHEVTLELRCVLANMGARRYGPVEDSELSGGVARDIWEEFWGGEGRAAFEALRERLIMHVPAGASYEQWLASFVAPDPQWADDDAGDDDGDDGDDDDIDDVTLG